MSNAVIDPNIPNIEWPLPFNEDAKPICYAYYIYIKNSKSINQKSIKKFNSSKIYYISKRWFNSFYSI